MIICRNVSGNTVSINDLGIILEAAEELDLEENFNEKSILDSEDLESQITDGNLEVEIETAINQTWNDIIVYLKRVTKLEHEKLDTLTHVLSEVSFFEATKDVNNRTQYITYYTDETKTTKIREEEIIRLPNKKASSIIIRQYDKNGVLVKTESQILNREGGIGKVESISCETI